MTDSSSNQSTSMPNTASNHQLTTHILLVEDDPAIALSLKVTFKREGWQVTWLDNASSVLPKLEELHQSSTPLSAIILDVGLPDGDGLSLCQTIRHHADIGELTQLPILFLTARSDEVDRILGLEMGGDDYCTKPFSPRELVARLKAIWRRDQLTHQTNSTTEPSIPSISSSHPIAIDSAQTNDDAPIEFNLTSGQWRYEPLTYSLYWNDAKLDLSNTERKLLLTLLQNPDRVFSREQLLNAISDYPDHRLARTVDSHIKAIRKQLTATYQKSKMFITEDTNNESADDHVEIIHTHRGIGYGLYPA